MKNSMYFKAEHNTLKKNGGEKYLSNFNCCISFFKRTLARYSAFAVIFMFLGIFSFGEIPHTVVYDNPNREVTTTDTIKRHKEKAELNITVTKIKSQVIKAQLDNKAKKIYFNLNRDSVKRSDFDFKLETTDKIFVSERLEEVPSISTTNGRKKINGLKRQNKSLDTGTIKDGNLTWTVRDLRSAEGGKAVTVEYKSLPSEIYVGVTDKDYNIKKIFYGNFSSDAPYVITELDGYVSSYNEDVKVNNKYEYDISDVVMWTKDNTAVDIKFAELTMNPINNVTLMNKHPYFAVEDEVVTVQKGRETVTGRLHLINTSFASSVPMNLKMTRADDLVSKVMTEPNILNTGTNLLTVTAYIRLKAEDYKKLSEGTFTVNKGIVYGTDEGISQPIQLPQMNVYHTTSADGKTIDLDFWVFGTDFADKINYVINPRNNGTGNLEERALDEKTGVTDTTFLTGTDSVFDMTGRGVKYDFYDTDTIEIQGVKDVIPSEQNKGSFEHYKNRWASATIPGYKVKARIWSDYDGIELDFEKTASLSLSTEGVRKFKVVHKNGDGKIVQTWNINLYINNIEIKNRNDYITTSGIRLSYTNSNYNSKFNMKNKLGELCFLSDTDEYSTWKIGTSLIGKDGDLKTYFPINTKGIFLDNNDIYGKQIYVNYQDYQITDRGTIGNWNGDYLYAKTDSNGLSKFLIFYKIPFAKKWVTHQNHFNAGESYFRFNSWYGNGKRKINYWVREDAVNYSISENYYTGTSYLNIVGIPILAEKNGYKNMIIESRNLGVKVFYSPTTTSKFNKDNEGFYTGSTVGVMWTNPTTIKINNEIIMNKGNYVHWEGKIKEYNDVFFYGTEEPNVTGMGDSFPITTAFGIKKWTMSKNNVNYKIEHIGGEKYVQNEPYHYTGIINIKPFDPLFMFDKEKSSMGEILVVIKDIDMTPGYVPPKQIVDLAEVTFKYLNVKALRQNTSLKPKFVLPDEVYLNFKDGSGTVDDRIKAKLSFSNERDNLTFVEMEDKGGDYAGGNNTRVYLHIEPEEYKKMLLNGHGKQYQVFGNFVNNKHGVPDERDTTDVVKIGVVATTTPDGGSRYEPFFATVLDSLNVVSRAVIPIPYTVKFRENEPLIQNDLQLIENSIKYVDMPSGYNYNNTVSLSGNVKPYDYFIKAHKYEITDTTGKTLADYTGSSGSGAYWENLALGNNKVTIYHKRDFGTTDGYQTRELTFMKLNEWNFEEYTGHIIEKHFLPHSDHVNQYYDIGISVPAFNPHIYYENTGENLRLDEEVTVQRQTGQLLYDLGSVSTNNFDTNITKHSAGALKDELGLRVVPGDSLTIKEVESGKIFPEKAKIVFIEKVGDSITELSYDKLNPNRMIGPSQKARIGIKLPQGLNVSKDYVIEGAGAGIIDKAHDLPSSEYILAIGRNKYFKECIPQINLSAERLVGEFTLTFNNEYAIRNLQGFNSTTLQKREPTSLINPLLQGVTLENIQGAGILQMESGDILEVQEMGGRGLLRLNVGSNGTSEKKELLLNDSKTKLSVQTKDGKMYLGLNMWRMGNEHHLILKVFRGSNELMNQKMTLKTPNTQFIITQMGELDFGNLHAGTKDNYAETDFEMFTTEEIDNIEFEVSTSTPILESGTTKSILQARGVRAVVMDQGTKEREYKLKINGFLDVPEGTPQGSYTGSMTLKLKIK